MPVTKTNIEAGAERSHSNPNQPLLARACPHVLRQRVQVIILQGEPVSERDSGWTFLCPDCYCLPSPDHIKLSVTPVPDGMMQA
jgi:hypothetical protein